MTRPADPLLPFERPLGATVVGEGLVEFRVWAPEAEDVRVRRAERSDDVAMSMAGLGTWEATVDGDHGQDYWFVLDGTVYPDPCSRWQPDGLRGPSRVMDVSRLVEPGVRPLLDRGGLVLYELHVGAFTDEGTFDAVIPHLAALAELGVTAIELMPVNQFPGVRGWGYDGVYPSAAECSYGGPEGLARLVAAAHGLSLGVILDVVYNHVGADGGAALAAFGPYFTDRHQVPWGAGLNTDGPDCDGAREWALQSAVGWVRDFGVDGLRVDALHAISDGSAHHLCARLVERVRAVHADALLIAESGLNDPRTLRPPDEGGWGFDGDWADDFHHALHTLVTGETDGWYADYGTVDHLARAFASPYLFDGGYVPFRRRRFGAPADDRELRQFVVFDQNHDQVGNRALGDRPRPEVRALSMLCTLFAPATPMLFMGEEYGEDAPFPFFSNHLDPEIAAATQDGRRHEFEGLATWDGADIPDPEDPATFASAQLTRVRDEVIAGLCGAMLALRPRLPLGRPDLSEPIGERGLRVRRGPFELVANFGSEALVVQATGDLVVTAGAVTGLPDGRVVIGPRSGLILDGMAEDTK